MIVQKPGKTQKQSDSVPDKKPLIASDPVSAKTAVAPAPATARETAEQSLPTQTKPKAETQSLFARLTRWLDRDQSPTHDELKLLFTSPLTNVAANKLAKQWCALYDASDESARRALLSPLAEVSSQLEPRKDLGLRLFRRLYAQAENLRLLVQLRADMLRWKKSIPALAIMETELEGLLSSWFDVGMLELRPITWDSPASLLEKLIEYEAVHEIRSWQELKHRVAADRRCYAFFHPRMSDEPLIFVEVAITTQMANNVQILLDPSVPTDNPDKARWAMFYSISNTQPGLRGISFGNFLLKRVIDALLVDLPKLKNFATLSPIPGFVHWLNAQDGNSIQNLLTDKADKQAAANDPEAGKKWVKRLRDAATASDPKADNNAQRSGMRLAAHYLKSMKNDQPLDPVARFHLGNGARIEQVNWAADSSRKGLEQSCGLMVNYLYELQELDDNLKQLAAGKPKVGLNLRWR